MYQPELFDAFKAVVSIMSEEFDSHDFIKKFMQYYTSSYADILTKFKSIPTAHGHIVQVLKRNADSLQIKSIGRIISLDVFNETTECELWHKNNNSGN